MKKVILILVASLSVAALFSCQRVKEEVIPEGKPDIHTLSVRFPEMTDQNGTKVSLATTGKTQWEVGDKLVIYGNPSSSNASKRVVHEIVAGDITNPEVAVFDVDFGGLEAQDSSDPSTGTYYPYTVAYPYTDGQPYYVSTGSSNYGRSRFQNTNQLLMAGHVSDDKSSIVLYPVTAAITFSVSGDFDSYIFSGKAGTEVVGYSHLVVEGNRRRLGEGKYRQKYKADGGTSGPLTSISGSVNGDGSAVNHIFLPVNAERKGSSPAYTYDTESVRYANVVYLPNGFTIQLLKDGVIKKYISSSAPLIMKPGHMINLGVLPAGKLYDYSLELQRLARLGRTPIVSTYFTKNTPSAPTLANVRCFTHINVGPVRFVNKTTGDGGLEIPSPGANYMQRLAEYKEDYPELKLLLFIGGWGANGDGFSEMAKNPDKRALFCSECLRICNEYNFDGVDIDWEYPTYAAKDGDHYNGADSHDTENFSILMRELRRTLGPYRLISYAASDSGQYIDNLGVLEWVDYINVMTYSMGNPPYHNSPLYRSTLTRSRSGEESIEIFHKQGVPYNRMNYGLAFYGHADGTIYPSSMPYNKIVEALTTNEVDGKSVAGYNIRHWDDTGKNVYLGDSSGNMYASYEDTESLSYRVAFVKTKGMLGAFSWEYREDDNVGTLRNYVYNAFYPSSEP